jgi:hypothetical protein
VTEDWRKLHIEEYHAFYSSPNIIKMISRKIRWVGHIARMGEKKAQHVGSPSRLLFLRYPFLIWDATSTITPAVCHASLSPPKQIPG